MKILAWKKTIGRVQLEPKEVTYRSLVFDVTQLPTNLEPKRIEFFYPHPHGKYADVWSVSWNRFGKMGCVGDLALIHKEKLNHVLRHRKD